MNYMQVLLEECKDLMNLLESGKISKHDAANTLMDIGALIEAKKSNQQALDQEFKDAESDTERNLIRDAIRKQWKEKIELEKLVCILSADLKKFMTKKNNIIQF